MQALRHIASALARDPSLLAEIKVKLGRKRDTFPLFNAARFAREARYDDVGDLAAR